MISEQEASGQRALRQVTVPEPEPDAAPARSTLRAQSRQEKRECTRVALLDAAERLWAERGIRGASIDDIAAAAGMTKGAVYSNFTGKTDLLLALLDQFAHADLGLDIYPVLRDSSRSLEERFEQAGKMYARQLGTEEARLLALLLVEFWLYGMREFSAGWRIADWYHARRKHLADDLADVDGMSSDDRAALAMAMDFGLACQHLLDPERVSAELYATGMRLVLGPALPPHRGG